MFKRGVNDLRVLRPDLLEEWDYAKNSANDTFPEDFTTHSKEKVWWKCAACGNGWQATIKNRADNNSGCPTCMKYNRTSFPEQAIVFYLSMIFIPVLKMAIQRFLVLQIENWTYISRRYEQG